MRIILDGVFNHSSRGFHAFNDIMENESESPYRNWFHVRRFPLRAYEPGHARNYQAWWGIKGLPKFNTDYPPVRRYLLNVARYWIEQGLDGWRLDVPNEIDDDDFWAEFREVVRAANPEAYLVGEIWHPWPRWANDKHFDGLMNYPLRTAVLELLSGNINAAQFGGQVESLLNVYPRENVYAMYNLLGSHDTERILTLFGGDGRKVSLAFLFLFAYPGVPSIYYGDEIGMRGGKDPGSRGAFPWDPAQRDEGLREWMKKLISAHKTSAAFARGDFLPLFAGDADGRYAFARQWNGEQVIIAINGRDSTSTINIPVHALALEDGHLLQSLLDDRQVTVVNGSAMITLDPYSGIYLR
jgi:glycosidase